MSLDAPYFDALYNERDDPWRLAERWYEKRKRALTVAILPRQRFARALEIGCSIGALTAELAPRCDSLLATDIAERAVEIARKRMAGASGVAFRVMRAPEQWPDGTFDLIVLSEMGYYLDESALRRLFARSVESLAPDGVILACHWRHAVADYPLPGDRVHELLQEVPGVRVLESFSDEDFLLEVFAPTSAVSVATAEGLVSGRTAEPTSPGTPAMPR